jgi:hypothetical protein
MLPEPCAPAPLDLLAEDGGCEVPHAAINAQEVIVAPTRPTRQIAPFRQEARVIQNQRRTRPACSTRLEA